MHGAKQTNVQRLRHEAEPCWYKLLDFAKSSTESTESVPPPKSSNCNHKAIGIYAILDILELSVFCNSKKHPVKI